MLIPGSLIITDVEYYRINNEPTLVLALDDAPEVLKPGMSKLGDHLANNKRWQYSNLITVTLYFLYDRETFKLTVLKSIEHNRVDKISAYLFDGRYVLRYES
jgi:hypothetical protein